MKEMSEYFVTGLFYISFVWVSKILIEWLFGWIQAANNYAELLGYITYILLVVVAFGYIISLIRRFINWFNE